MHERALELAATLAPLGHVAVTRFFGGYALSLCGVQFAFLGKGTLYLRTDVASRSIFEARGAAPFTYAGRSKEVTVTSYYEAPAEVIEDPEELIEWAARAHRAALALRAAKPPRPKRSPKGSLAKG